MALVRYDWVQTVHGLGGVWLGTDGHDLGEVGSGTSSKWPW